MTPIILYRTDLYDLCGVKVYKVLFENNTAISAIPNKHLQHNDLELNQNQESVKWIAIECEDPKTAMEIADMVVKQIWGKDAA